MNHAHESRKWKSPRYTSELHLRRSDTARIIIQLVKCGIIENDQRDCGDLQNDDEYIFKCKLLFGVRNNGMKKDIDEETVKFLKCWLARVSYNINLNFNRRNRGFVNEKFFVLMTFPAPLIRQ